MITLGSPAEDVGNSEKSWDYNAATHYWSASTGKFIRIQSILQLLLSTKPLGSKHKSYSTASSIANIIGTQCGGVQSLEISMFKMVSSEDGRRGRKLGALAMSALRLPGEFTEMWGRKTGILSSESMYCPLKVHWNSVSSEHHNLNIKYSTRSFPSISKDIFPPCFIHH